MKLSQSIASALENKPKEGLRHDTKYLWETVILSRFSKSKDTSRMLYVLLDDVQQMKDFEREKMLDLFKTLDSS